MRVVCGVWLTQCRNLPSLPAHCRALGPFLWGPRPGPLAAGQPASHLSLGPLQRGLAPSRHSPWGCEPPDGRLLSLCVSATLTVMSLSRPLRT